MKSFEHDILKLVEKTRLKAAERAMVRERILSYMEYHPLPKSVDVSMHRLPTEREFFYIRFSTPLVKYIGGALAFLLIVGVPLLAERTVPGDPLYLVKTGVNETIRTQFATSPYAKVQLETRLIERRLAEARLLAVEGKLTEDVEAHIAETVRGHVVAVQNGIAELRIDDADGAAMAEIVFDSALEVQSVVLGEKGEGSTTQGDVLRAVVDNVRSEVLATDNLVIPSYETLVAKVEQETTRSYELFQSIKDTATPEEVGDIERRLNDIDRTITEAKALQDEDETGAVAELMEVLGLTQKLIAFMTDIDVREAVSLETLVPIKLTIEERTGNIEERMKDITLRMEAIRGTNFETLIPPSILEKISPSIDNALELMNRINEALAVKEIENSELLSGELEALVLDIEKLIQQYTPKITEESEVFEEIELPPLEGSSSTPTTTTTIPVDEGSSSTPSSVPEDTEDTI